MDSPLSSRRGGAAIALVVVLALLGGGFCLYWFVLRDAGGAGAAAELATRAIPAEAEFVGGADVQALLSSSSIAELAAMQGLDIETMAATLAEQGIDPKTIQAVVFGLTYPQGSAVPDGLVAIIKGTFDASIVDKVKAATFLATQGQGVPLDQIALVAPGTLYVGGGPLYETALRQAKAPAAAAPPHSALDDLVAHIDRGASMWIAGPVPPPMARILRVLSRSGIPGLGKLGSPSHFAFSLHATATLVVRAAARFPDNVEDIIALMSSGLSLVGAAMSGERRELLKALDLSARRNVAILAITLPTELAKKLAAEGSPF